MTLKEKLLEIVNSPRFLLATLAWLSDYMSELATTGFTLEGLFVQISKWLATVVVIGSADSIAQKISSKKAE